MDLPCGVTYVWFIVTMHLSCTVMHMYLKDFGVTKLINILQVVDIKK